MNTVMKSLFRKLDTLQPRIDDEQARPAPDSLKLRLLKKLKLRFKDEIAFIERTNKRGQPVAIPVERRRALRTAPQGRF
jgi:hypothetical protein